MGKKLAPHSILSLSIPKSGKSDLGVLRLCILVIGILSLLAGCATGSMGPKGGTATLSELQKVSVPAQTGRPHHGKKNNSGALSDMRLGMLKDTALSLGARSGLAWQSTHINAILSHDEKELDATYNFYGLMLPHDILPPVLLQAQNTLNLAGPNTLRLAQKVYRLAAQAHFVTAPPTWRDFIWMNYPQPQLPNNTLLPRTRLERSIWNHYAAIGWENGIKQGDNIFQANLNSLNQTYNGMVLYRKLYQMNMVSAPFVAKTNLGITGDGSHMNINDQVLRITALPQLNLKGNTWKAIIVPDPINQQRLKQKLSQQLALVHAPKTKFGYVK